MITIQGDRVAGASERHRDFFLLRPADMSVGAVAGAPRACAAPHDRDDELDQAWARLDRRGGRGDRA